jgi:hypothetical protein
MLGAVGSAESAELGSRPLSTKKKGLGAFKGWRNQSTESKVTQAAQGCQTRYKWLKVLLLLLHGFFIFWSTSCSSASASPFDQQLLRLSLSSRQRDRRAHRPLLSARRARPVCEREGGGGGGEDIHWRDLRDLSVPTWLNGLACGYGLVCAVTSAGRC